MKTTYANTSGGSGAAGLCRDISPEVQEWFHIADTNASGSLNSPELKVALVRAKDINFSDAAVRFMIGLFDHDRNGTIDVNEFQQLYTYINQWQHVFQMYDLDNSGYLEQQELSNALAQMGYRLSPEFVQLVMRLSDVRNTHQISFDQFIVMCVQLQRYTETFSARDPDRKGVITLSYEDYLSVVLDIALQ